MINQTGVKKIDSVLTNKLKRLAFNDISLYKPAVAEPIPLPVAKSSVKKGLLPPIEPKLIDTQESSKEILTVLPKPSDEYLLMGDVVTLIAVGSEDLPASSGVITGDGVAHNFLDCIPASFFVTTEKVQIRLCLFRIEPVRQYGYSSIFRNYVKMKSKNDDQKNELKEAQQEEHLDNESEAEVTYGKVLTFGERIQLKHIHSNSFITTSKEVSRERGCLQVILDSIGSEGSWFELKSSNLIRHDGEAIKYSDNFYLTLMVDNSRYYLHMGTPKSWKEDQDYELNASSNYTYWQVRKYISHSAIKQNPSLVTTGDSFRIAFKKSQGYLAASPRNIEEILPSELDIDQIKFGKQKDKKESSAKVYIEKSINCLSVWELVRENPFIGGMAEISSLYRIKHVATNLMLCVTKTGNLYLTYELNSEFSLFKIIQEPSNTIYHTFNTLVKIESPALKKIIIGGGVEIIDTMFFNPNDINNLPVSMIINKKQDTRSVFVLIDEPEDKTIYIYQISSLIPKIIVFYRYIKLWGSLKKGTSFTQNFELAKNTEAELESQVNFLVKILHTIKKRMLTDASFLKERQTTLRLTGMLHILMRFAILVDKKLDLPSKFPIEAIPKNIRKSKTKVIQEAPKYLKPELLQFPAVVGSKSLSKLGTELYETIYHSVKDNKDSCIALQMYQEFLSSQLYSYKAQVGLLLKELYKQSSGSIVKSDPQQFKIWIEQLKPISEKDENIDQQMIVLKILGSLCTNNGQGIPKNQKIISDYFFSVERDYTILKCIYTDDEPLVGFLTDKTMSFADFLGNNSILLSHSVENKDNMVLVYLNDISKEKVLVDYLSNVLDFIVALCVSRNKDVIEKVIKNMGFSFEYLLLATSSDKIHCKIRKHCLKLIWILYFDTDTQTILSKSQQKCFLWNTNTNTIEEETPTSKKSPGILEKMAKKPIPYGKVLEWVNKSWTTLDLPFKELKTESLSDGTRYIIELIIFTKNLADYSYINYTFIKSITPSMLALIDTKTNSLESGWTSKYKQKLGNLRNDSLGVELIASVINFFETKFYAKINGEVRQKISEFNEKQDYEVQIPENIQIHKHKKKGKKNNIIYPDSSSIQDNSLDTILLNLLFYHTDVELKEKIINLLLFSFNLNSKVCEALDDTVLLPNDKFRDFYVQVKNAIEESNRNLCFIKYLDSDILVGGITQPNPEIFGLANAVKANFNIIKSLLSKKNSKNDNFLVQKICKNLNVHLTALSLFTDDWPWVEKIEKRIKLDLNVSDLYRAAIKTLVNFTYLNTENQLIIFDYIKIIESYKGNNIVTKNLIAEVIKSKRDTPISLKMIENTFKSLGQTQNPMERPQDLLIIKNLIFNEQLKFYYSTQTTVIKSLLSTKNLRVIFSCDTPWDLSKYSSKSIKFFSSMLDIISWCSIFNDYCTYQARRMIPYKVIIKQMNSTSMLLIKKAYLHFIFYVFFMKTDNIQRELPEDIIEDILKNIIYADISKYKNYIDHIIALSLKGMYHPIKQKKSMNKVLQDSNKKLKSSKIDELTREQAESLEYWKYINSHKPDTPRVSTGLISVIKDIVFEYNLNDLLPSSIATLFFNIKSELRYLIDDLYDKSFQCEDIDMEFMIREICETMLEIPYFTPSSQEGLEEAGRSQKKAYDALLSAMKEYIETKHLPFEEFIDNEFKNLSVPVGRYYFINYVKTQLCLKITCKDLESVTRYLEPSNVAEISLNQLVVDLKKLFIEKPYIVRKERVSSSDVKPLTSYDINSVLDDYKLAIRKILEEGENDIDAMVSNVKIQLIDPALLKNDTEVLLKFIKNLEQAFHKPEHTIYLIKILKNILLQEIKNVSSEDNSQEKNKYVQIIQNLYASENIIHICFSALNYESSIEKINLAISLLCYLIKFNNTWAKQKILDYLKVNGFNVLSFIRSYLRDVQDLLVNLDSKITSSKKKIVLFKGASAIGLQDSFKQIQQANKILLFLQLCCDNCFLPFQEFLQVQDPTNPVSNINIVNEISQFLIRLEGLSDLKSEKKEKTETSKIAAQCIKTLADSCQGPCRSNQLLLGQSRRLYEFMNWLLTNPSPNFSEDSVWLELYAEAVKFLNALIEANLSLKVAKTFIREIDLEMLTRHAAIIWKQIAKGREKIVYQNNAGPSLGLKCLEIRGNPLQNFEKDLIDTGFSIHILILTLQYMHPVECNIKLGKIDYLSNEFVKFNLSDKDLKSALVFYASNISTVEINNRDTLAKLFFRVPVQCRFLTKKSEGELITKVNRASHQEKIEDFCNKSKIYEIEMQHQQKIARYPALDLFLSNWRIYGKLSYVTILVINIILLATIQHEEGNTGSWVFYSNINHQALLTFVAVIQIVLASLVFLCYIFEYFPVIKFKNGVKSKGSQTNKYFENEFNRVKGTELMKEILIRTETKHRENVSNILITFKMLFFDFECVYNLLYLTISILCWEYPLLYSVLLLDLIKRNPDLKNILRSITLNSNQLIITTILGIIVLYIFSIVAFLEFSSFYSSDFTEVGVITYCNTLIDCIISTALTGIEQGGGIGDALVHPLIEDPQFLTLIIFNLLYFAIVINILLNIIFGIIIDTFGELRDQNQAELKDIEENCFVCGNQRFMFEVRKISWGYHINIEHNPKAYLAFLIYIRHKPVDECTGAEKYVKEKLEKNETIFFPLTSLSLQSEDDEKVDELTSIQTKVSKILELSKNIK